MAAPQPKLPEVGPLAGTDRLIVIQDGRPKLGLLSVIAAFVALLIQPSRVSTGRGAPNDAVGNSGDVYIDAASGDVYRKDT